MNTCLNIEPEVDNLVELTSICRGEWCRLLESEMDELEMELHDFTKSGDENERLCVDNVSEKFRLGYKNVSPIFII
jgi:hypothetical protein